MIIVFIIIFLISLYIVLGIQTVQWFKNSFVYGCISLLGNFIIGAFITMVVLTCFVVIDTNNKTIQGRITNVEKNFGGTYTIYIRTNKNEKYCTENSDIGNMANELIGREVILGKGTREGMYGITKCHEAPIVHIERVKDVQSKNNIRK